jgi:hypothetical protein
LNIFPHGVRAGMDEFVFCQPNNLITQPSISGHESTTNLRTKK